MVGKVFISTKSLVSLDMLQKLYQISVLLSSLCCSPTKPGKILLSNKTYAFIMAFPSISMPFFWLQYSGIHLFFLWFQYVWGQNFHMWYKYSFPDQPPDFQPQVIRYSAIQRLWLGQRKQGKGRNWLQFLFVFLCGHWDCKTSNFHLLYRFSPLPIIDPGSIKQKLFFLGVLEGNTQLKHRCVCLTGIFAMEVPRYHPGRIM